MNQIFKSKKFLFTSAAGVGGLLSGLIYTSFDIFNSNLFSWVGGGALDSAFISALIIYAQNYYQTKNFKLSSGFKYGIKRGLLIGGLGGIIAYITMTFLGAGTFGRIIGWGVSGGIAGYTVSTQIPNLRTLNAIIAGVIGGVLGCLFMIMNLGYTFGVIVTGASIGMSVAIAEVVFRKNWIDVTLYNNSINSGLNLQKPVNQFNLTLGINPITIGYGNNMDIQLQNSISNSSNHLASIYLDGNDAIFFNIKNSEKTKLVAGKSFIFLECDIKLGV